LRGHTDNRRLAIRWKAAINKEWKPRIDTDRGREKTHCLITGGGTVSAVQFMREAATCDIDEIPAIKELRLKQTARLHAAIVGKKEG
jgi:hypothetical protein